MIQNDTWIKKMASQGMIVPFESNLIRRVEELPVISFGLSSFGYDIRLSPKEFRVFRHIPGTVVDPKNFNPDNLEPVQLHTDENGSFFILPAHSYGLGVALEKLKVPDDITILCIGKSSYARCFRGDTRVALVDGTSPTLEEMTHRAEQGEQFWGYSIGEHGRLIVTLLENPRYIGQDSLVEVILDNQESVFCTPDHLFMRRDGRMVQAQDLHTNDCLMPLYRQVARGYEMVYQPLNGHLYPTHRLSDEWMRRFSEKQSRSALAFWHDPKHAATRQAVLEQRRNCSDATRQTHREALEQAGSIRGAARLLNCDRSVFRRFPKVIHSFRGTTYKNHKVVSVRNVAGTHDVYCLTVPEAGNFALESGVFVHNCGLIANLTPAEAGWRGYLTLEFSNSSSADCRIYANEGVVQLLFLKGEPCEVSYSSRQGKYQDQGEEVTLARV